MFTKHDPEVPMTENKDTKRLSEDDNALAGDALLHAVLREVKGLSGLVKAVDERVEALDAKVEARLRDTTPMWEVAVSRLDTVIAEQESQGRRLDAIEAEHHSQGARLDAIDARLDAIESEQRSQGARLDAIERHLDAIEVKLERFDAIDTELRHLSRRIERTIAELSGDVVKFRVDQHDLEDRLEKLEKTPA
jgi:chromosome segregation ATPase